MQTLASTEVWYYASKTSFTVVPVTVNKVTPREIWVQGNGNHFIKHRRETWQSVFKQSREEAVLWLKTDLRSRLARAERHVNEIRDAMQKL